MHKIQAHILTQRHQTEIQTSPQKQAHKNNQQTHTRTKRDIQTHSQTKLHLQIAIQYSHTLSKTKSKKLF